MKQFYLKGVDGGYAVMRQGFPYTNYGIFKTSEIAQKRIDYLNDLFDFELGV